MILTPWKRLIYLLSFMGVLYFLYPTNTEMVLLHLEGDDPVRGERFLREALKKEPDDFDLRVLSAELNWAHDRVDPALDDLQSALSIKPHNLRALVLDATYLEWAQHMEEAYHAWERVADRDKKRVELNLKLAVMAASLEKPAEAAAHAARWALALGAPPKGMSEIPYFMASWAVLNKLSQEVLAGNSDDLTNDAVYHLATAYSGSLRMHAEGERVFDGYAAKLMRTCILAGLVDEATGVATDLDQMEGGLDSRRLLINLMEVAGMSERAEYALMAMVQKAPDQEDTLLALLDMGEGQGMTNAKTLALERLARVNPGEERYRSQLIAQYVDAGRYDRIAELMDRLAWFTGAGIRYAKQVVAAAFVSGDSTFMNRVYRESDKLNTRDPEIISARARLALALKDYRKGAELAQALSVLAPSETADVLKKVLEGGDYDAEAMGDALAVALSLTPEDTHLMKASALNSRAQGHSDAAFSLMRRAVLVTRDFEDFRALVEMSRETEVPEQALREADHLGERVFGRHQHYLRASVDIRLELDNASGAFEAQRELFSLSPGRDEAAKLLELAQTTGKPEDARTALALARGAFPHDPGLTRQAVDLALADSDLGHAETALNAYLKLVPGDETALRQMADVASWTNRPELEARMLDRLVQAGTATRQDRMRLAQALEASGQGPKALEMVLGLLEAQPGDTELLKLGMRYALWNGSPGTAASLGEKLCAMPGGRDWLVPTGEAWLGVSRPDKALPWLEKARAAGQGGADSLRLLMQAYQGLNRPAPMLDAARELEACAPLSPDEILAVASAEAALGRWNAVLERLGPLGAKRPLDTEGSILMCQALLRTGSRGESLKLMKSLAERRGADATLLARVGETAYAAGDRSFSGDVYRKALALEPANAAALRGLATVLAEEGRTAKASRLMDRHNSVNPEDADSRIQTAEMSATLGDEAKARREYKRALRILNKQAKAEN